MSYYSLGIQADHIQVWPTVLEPAFERAGVIAGGIANIRTGESRFYAKGLSNRAIPDGPTEEGDFAREIFGSTAGNLTDNVVNLLLDLTHAALVVAGGFVLWSAFSEELYE